MTDRLAALAAGAEAPAELVLDVAGVPTCFRELEVLRRLDGRRLVLKGTLLDGPESLAARMPLGAVVLKVFLGSGHRRYFEREAAGLERLEAAGVTTPTRYYSGSEGQYSLLLLEYLADAAALQAEDDGGVAGVAELLGRLHKTGCSHGDLHLDNFLLTRGRIVAIDGDGVTAGARPGTSQALNNLAVLAAQRPPIHDDQLAALLAAYGAGAEVPEPPVATFQPRLDRARRQRLLRYARKSQRACSEFSVRRGPGQTTFALRDGGEPLLEALLGAEVLVPTEAFLELESLKEGRSATVVRVPEGYKEDRGVVVKRFNVKDLVHRLRRSLRPMPRYRRAWVFGQLLHFQAIPTARPLVLMETRQSGLRDVAYLIMEDIGGRTIADEVAELGLSDARIAETCALFGLLRRAGFIHGDTKASNFVLHDNRLHVIDLDAMRFAPRGFAARLIAERRFRADVLRFLANWADPERQRFADAFSKAGLL
ncbi:MAG: lipopolysaccharide kinase InaA family protein [Pseudomonadota bacterium]